MKTATKLKHIVAISAVTATLGACSAVSGRETAGQYVDDTAISTDVRAKLVGDTGFKATQIHVETMQGVVLLSGFVDKPEDRMKADHIAWDVKGVKSVKDSIVVRPPSDS
ncbi:MAG TPA: BON domain-containing protein [Magnetospirillaceae bacterium]